MWGRKVVDMTRDFDETQEKVKAWRPDGWANKYQDDPSNTGAHRRPAFEEGADAMLGPAFVAGIQYAAKHLDKLADKVDDKNWPVVLDGNVVHLKPAGK